MLVDDYVKAGKLSRELGEALKQFFNSYLYGVPESATEVAKKNIEIGLKLVIKAVENPYNFGVFHKKIRQPFDYYQFGIDFFRPLVNFEHSTVLGVDSLDRMVEQLEAKENVVLFANHQTEPDPQLINLLLEKTHPHLAEEMIYVAGHRVTTDPIAVPFSMGRNLLCIYSKKYVENPPEKKHEKVLHNQQTMKKMRDLLSEGGKCIYVAPSGGRDRVNEEGIVEVAPFDPQSLELFHFVAKKAQQPTHFYPLALSTYDILPPPKEINIELGEERKAKHTAVHLWFGEEIDMLRFPGSDDEEKSVRRVKRAEYIWKLVCKGYESFPI